MDALTDEQTSAFAAIGLSRDAGLGAIDRACRERFGHGYDENNGMFSEHLVLIASIACAQAGRIRSFLEIGTFNGQSAVLFSHLFPEAEILTIDLPSDSPQFVSSYQRENSAETFARARNALLEKLPNVRFASMDSVSLTAWPSESFDLVWVDGAHGYPVVCADLINAYRLARAGGIVMVDDVWIERDRSDAMYKSTAAYETLESMRGAGLFDSYRLFLKRVGSAFNVRQKQKFVGHFNRPAPVD